MQVQRIIEFFSTLKMGYVIIQVDNVPSKYLTTRDIEYVIRPLNKVFVKELF